ncbi:MAG: hypothetical protein EOO15_16600 [Chitinophagaceae bacterium]|nr:MAG: hypothetical protein EOO15_16600 [Chitinophagaceae bacterium]
MRIILPFVLAALVGCSKESAIEDMSTSANDEQTVASMARTSAPSAVEGSWRRTETRYNRGDGQHYWVAIPADQQVVVTFDRGKLIAGDHPYLSMFNAYSSPKPGILTLTGLGRTDDVQYVVSGTTLELTYRQREDVVDRFVKQ